MSTTAMETLKQVTGLMDPSVEILQEDPDLEISTATKVKRVFKSTMISSIALCVSIPFRSEQANQKKKAGRQFQG